jgi:HD-like signal output (HDOD) protein
MIFRKLSEQAAIATGDFGRMFRELEIPSLPQAATACLEMAGDEDADVGKIAGAISSDPGISARVLRMVNSAHFGIPNRIGNVRQAVAMLGLGRIRSLVLGCGAIEALPRRGEGFDPEAFWRTSLQRSVFAEVLAREICRGSEGEAFTGALLQDMALPILLCKWGKHYRPVYESAVSSGRDLVLVEREELSWTHAEAGAWMARNWGFPDVLVCCVGLHHATLDEIAALDLGGSPVAAVSVSSRVPDAATVCRGELGFSEEKYRGVCEEVDRACEELAGVFEIPRPAPLAESPVSDPGSA